MLHLDLVYQLTIDLFFNLALLIVVIWMQQNGIERAKNIIWIIVKCHCILFLIIKLPQKRHLNNTIYIILFLFKRKNACCCNFPYCQDIFPLDIFYNSAHWPINKATIGQLISKCLVSVFNFFQNWTKTSQPEVS